VNAFAGLKPLILHIRSSINKTCALTWQINTRKELFETGFEISKLWILIGWEAYILVAMHARKEKKANISHEVKFYIGKRKKKKGKVAIHSCFSLALTHATT